MPVLPTTNQRSAVEKVFNTVELFEDILLRLSAPDLLDAYLTAKSWASVIDASIRLSRKLYLHPEPTSSGWTYDFWSSNLSPFAQAMFHSFQSEDTRNFSCADRTTYEARLHPLMLERDTWYDPYEGRTCTFGCPHVQAISWRACNGEMVRLLSPDLIRKTGTARDVHLQRMLLTQPPCKKARMAISVAHGAGERGMEIAGREVVNEDGLRLKDLRHAVEVMWEQREDGWSELPLSLVRLELVGVLCPSEREGEQLRELVDDAESGRWEETMRVGELMLVEQEDLYD